MNVQGKTRKADAQESCGGAQDRGVLPVHGGGADDVAVVSGSVNKVTHMWQYMQAQQQWNVICMQKAAPSAKERSQQMTPDQRSH